MLGKSRHAAAAIPIVVLVLSTVVIVPEAAFALDRPTPSPNMWLDAEPKSQNIQAGSSATFKVLVHPQGEWRTGNVTLSLVNPPQWITATFSPEKLANITKEDFSLDLLLSSNLTVKVAADAPQGNVTLTLRGTGVAYEYSDPFPVPHLYRFNNSVNVVLNIVPPSAIPSTVTATKTTTVTTEVIRTETATATLTSTSTTTLSTTTLTSTTTATSTEQVADPSIYAWAISATAVAAVLAIVLLRKRG